MLCFFKAGLSVFIYLCFWPQRVFAAACGLSAVAACGPLTAGGFSCYGAQALGAQASAVAAHSLSAGLRALECRLSRDPTHAPGTGNKSLYHRTTREVQKMAFKVRTSTFSESRT